jgi:phage baseplate assembly protein W
MSFLNSLSITYQGSVYYFDGSTAIDPAPDVGSPGEIFQNVWNTLCVPIGSQCLLRDFGFDPAPIDLPGPVATQILSSALAQAVRRWEPRARVSSCILSSDASGATWDAAITILIVVPQTQQQAPLLSVGPAVSYTTIDVDANGNPVVVIESMTV